MLKKSMAKVTRTPRRSITFTVEDAPGKQVAVAGTFNDWTPDRPLLDKEGNGVYSCRMMLEPGTYEYKFVVDGDTTTLERLLEDYDDESVIEEGRKTLHISVPSKSIDITVDKKQGELRVNADGRKVSVKASETGDEASVTIRRETDAADSAKTTRGSAARSR